MVWKWFLYIYNCTVSLQEVSKLLSDSLVLQYVYMVNLELLVSTGSIQGFPLGFEC